MWCLFIFIILTLYIINKLKFYRNIKYLDDRCVFFIFTDLRYKLNYEESSPVYGILSVWSILIKFELSIRFPCLIDHDKFSWKELLSLFFIWFLQIVKWFSWDTFVAILFHFIFCIFEKPLLLVLRC